MQKIILVKIGGSVFTDKSRPYSLKKSVLKRLADELKVSKIPLVIAHGNGSFGHPSAKTYLDAKVKTPELLSKAAYDSLKINEIVTKIFVENGLPVISLHPMSLTVASEKEPNSNFYQTIELTLKNGCIPLLHGDLIWNEGKGISIFSGETTLFYLTKYLLEKGYLIEKIIFVGRTYGIYDAKGKTIPQINQKNWDNIKKNVAFSKGNQKITDIYREIDVTGGIIHKVEMGLKLAQLSKKVLLINGLRKEELIKSLKDKYSNKLTKISID